MIWFWFPIAVVCAVAGAFFAWKAISESLDRIFSACPESSRRSSGHERAAVHPSLPSHRGALLRRWRSWRAWRRVRAQELSPFRRLP